jgi:hypothetical protein
MVVRDFVTYMLELPGNPDSKKKKREKYVKLNNKVDVLLTCHCSLSESMDYGTAGIRIV